MKPFALKPYRGNDGRDSTYAILRSKTHSKVKPFRYQNNSLQMDAEYAFAQPKKTQQPSSLRARSPLYEANTAVTRVEAR